MKDRGKNVETGTKAQTDANTVLVAGHLGLHEHFQIRKNGKWYTVHAQVKQYMNDDDTNLGRGDFFTIAVCCGKMYAFDFYQRVLPYR